MSSVNNIQLNEDPEYYKGTDALAHERNNAGHRPGITYNEVMKYYDGWAASYEKDSLADGYRGFEVAADFCDILEPNKNARILDVGAGTGLAVTKLTQHGFHNIDALEPCRSLLEIAREKGVYKKLINEGILPDKQTSILDGTYDVVFAAGVFTEGHIATTGLFELARIVRSGGLIVIVMREEYLTTVKEYINRLEPLMDQMVANGIWQRLLRLQIPKYSFIKTGIAFIFRKN